MQTDEITMIFVFSSCRLLQERKDDTTQIIQEKEV